MDILTDAVVVDAAIKFARNYTKGILMVSNRTVAIQMITTTITAKANDAILT